MPTMIDPALYAENHRAENPADAARCCFPRATLVIGRTDDDGNSIFAYDTTKLCDLPINHGGNEHTWRRAFQAPVTWPR